VWLYYWDNRSGRDMSGWWFGSSVGGDEVYAKAEQHSALPPTKGWRVPHDAPKTADVSLIVKGHDEDLEIPEDERLLKVKELVTSLEAKVDKAVETSQSLLNSEGELFEEGVRAVCQLLESRVVDLEEAKAAAGRHSKAAKKQKASSETEAELGLLEERLDSALGKALKETQRAQEQLAKCEREGAEERDAKTIEAALPASMEVVAQAEMAVEAAGTDEAAMKARELIQTARQQVRKALETAQGFAPEAKKIGLAEFTSLQDRCDGAEKRLALWEGSGGGIAETIDVDADEGDAAEGGMMGAQLKPMTDALAGEEDSMEGIEQDIVADSGAPEVDPSLPEEEVLKQITAKVADVEGDAKQALETATIVLRDDSDVKGVKLCLELLEEHEEAVKNAQGKLAREVAAVKTRDVKPATAEALRALAPRLQVVRAHVSQELALAKRRVTKAQRQAREERDLQAAEVALPLALEAVVQAEHAVEAVILEAGDMEWRRKQMETAVQFGEEYGNDIQKAMEETQSAADNAQDAISAARTRLDAQIRAARGLPGEQQKASLAEMAPVRRRLIDAQKKLNPYRRVRTEFEQKLKAKDELETLSGKVAAVEADIEAASSALAGASASEDDVKSVEASVGPIQTALVKSLKLLIQKSKGIASGALQERLAGIQERVLAARSKLEELRTRAREERSQLVGHSLAVRAAKEVEKAEAWLARIKEVEAHWANDTEVLPEAQALEALEAAETLVKEALPAVQATKALVMERLVEARQLPEGILRLKTTEELQNFQARVDAVSLQLTQLKIDTFARRTKMHMVDVVRAVAKAETEVQAIVKAAEPFGEDNLESVPAKRLQDVGAKVLKCAQPIVKACEEARGAVASRQRDPKNRASPSFQTQLSKLIARLEHVETTVQGLCRAAREAGGNKKSLQEQKRDLAKLDQTVADVEMLTIPLGDEQQSEEAEEATAMKVRDMEGAIDTWRQAAEALADHPHTSMKLAMERLLARSGELQQRVSAAKAMIRDQNERALCRIFAREAQREVERAEEAMRQAEEAEGPFLKGIEVLSPVQTAETIAACEVAAARAGAVLDEVKAAVSGRYKEALSYKRQDAASQASIEEVSSQLQRVEGLLVKLRQYRNETEGRKRSAPSIAADGAPPAKVAKVG